MIRKITIPKEFISNFFIVVIFFELIFGGGGRLVEVGPLSLRMIFWFFASALSLFIIIFKGKLPYDISIIVLIYFGLLIFAALNGILNGASFSSVFIDIKPLLFIIFIFFLYYFINNIKKIQLLNKLFRYVPILMSIIYLIILYLLLNDKINFLNFYALTKKSDEFFFRGTEGYFSYKGFLYLGIGIFFWIYSESRKSLKIISILILLTALVLSGTRGYLLFLSVILFFSLILPKLLKGNILIIIASFIILFIAIKFLSQANLGNREESNSVRIVQLQQVFNSATPTSLIFGHGFGIGVPVRPIHMEVAYAEIFHKQGIIGLIFWLILIYYIIKSYESIKNPAYKFIVKPYFFASLFVVLMSFTNPYLNNPIGLTVILSTLVVINKFKKFEKT